MGLGRIMSTLFAQAIRRGGYEWRDRCGDILVSISGACVLLTSRYYWVQWKAVVRPGQTLSTEAKDSSLPQTLFINFSSLKELWRHRHRDSVGALIRLARPRHTLTEIHPGILEFCWCFLKDVWGIHVPDVWIRSAPGFLTSKAASTAEIPVQRRPGTYPNTCPKIQGIFLRPWPCLTNIVIWFWISKNV